MAAATAHPPSALMTSRTTRIAQANAPGAPLAVRTPAQEEYTAVVMASTSPVAPRRLLATAVRTATRSMANTIRAGGLTRKGPGSRSGSVPVVPPQQQPDNISNAALCRSGPGLIEQADRAGLQRGNGWAVLRPVRVEVEDVAKFLLGEAQEIRLTASLGFACFPEDTKSKLELLEMADRAMYHGKASGKNIVSHISDSLAAGLEQKTCP